MNRDKVFCFVRIVSVSMVISSLSSYMGLAQASDAPSTAIVLDASNSMWGQVDGKRKIDLARSSVAALLAEPSLQKSTQVLVYGSQSKTSCSDLKWLSDADNNEALVKQINALKPMGRSPIAAALTAAAEKLQGQGRIVLISDGTESCEQNPCEGAKTLKAKYPDLQIYTLSLNSQAANTTLNCISEVSQTTMLTPSNLASLLTQATPILMEGPTSGESQEAGTLVLSAGAAEQNSKLPANFVIYSSQGEVIDSITAKSEVSKKLSPGEYEVSALWGPIKQTAKLQVLPAQQLTHHFNLGALGSLNLKALDKAQQPVSANFTFYTANGDHIVDRLLKGNLQETLVQGAYKVKASFEGQTQEVLLTVKPETAVEHTFRFN